MAEESENVRLDYQQFAEAAAIGTSVADLSVEFGIEERQVYRRLKHPDIVRIIKEIRSGNVSILSGYQQRRLSKALLRINQLVKSSDERVALSAASKAFEIALKLKAFEEFEQRLAALEARQGIQESGETVTP